MKLSKMIDLLTRIEARVRPTICPTYSGATNTMTSEGRIMEEEVNTLQLIVAGLQDMRKIKLKSTRGRYLVEVQDALTQDQYRILHARLVEFFEVPVMLVSGLKEFRLTEIASMSPDLMQDIRDFHEKFDIAYSGSPRVLDPDLGGFRRKFLMEELEEYYDATTVLENELLQTHPDVGMITINLEQQLDALVDLVYVAIGTAYLQGFDFDEAWRRVHQANMRKVKTPSAEDSKRGSAFDVIKPPGWTPPTHADLVEDHEHQVKS